MAFCQVSAVIKPEAPALHDRLIHFRAWVLMICLACLCVCVGVRHVVRLRVVRCDARTMSECMFLKHSLRGRSDHTHFETIVDHLV